MTYILMIWTVVALAGDRHGINTKVYDWRPAGEYHLDNWERKYSAREMCERAAKELGLKSENYRCVRNR